MKVLQIHNRYRQPGGEDAVVAAEAELLRSAGHHVTQWLERNPEGAAATALGLVLSPWNPFRARSVASLTAEVEPDVAHVHNTWFAATPSVLGAVAAKDVPVVMTIHNYRLACANAQLLRDGRPCELCIDGSSLNAIRYACYRGSRVASAAAATTIGVHRKLGTWSKRVDRFLALTEFAKGRLVAGGLPVDKIRVKPNFVVDPGTRPQQPSASSTVLFVGRLSPEKGLRTLLAAWKANPPSGLELEIVGDGPLYDELAASGAQGVTFAGRLDSDAVRSRMHAARALVFPSEWYEGMPITILEAFAAGLPVLGSGIGSVQEIVGVLGDEWLFNPGDPAALASALAGLSDEAIDTAGAAARREYEARYSPARALDDLLAAYRF